MKFGLLQTILCSVLSTGGPLLLLTSCSIDTDGNIVMETEPASFNLKFGLRKTRTLPGSKYYSEHHYIHVNEALLPALNSSNSRIQIDLGDQRARVYKTGTGRDRLVIETQISTGKQGNDTPDGKFHVLEKRKDKKSNLYGTWVDAGSGGTLVRDGDSRNRPRGKPSAEFRGTPMPYWMRVTPGGVGMHVGYVPAFPASHGCIRVPRQVMPLIYSKAGIGTPVTITH